MAIPYSGVSISITMLISVMSFATVHTEYRIIYIKNNSSRNGERCKAYFSANWKNQVELAVDVAKNTTAITLTNEAAAPSGVTFSRPETRATALLLGDLNAGDYRHCT